MEILSVISAAAGHLARLGIQGILEFEEDGAHFFIIGRGSFRYRSST